MAYFPNGTSGETYQSKYCNKCLHWKEDEFGFSCPVWELHMQFNYEQGSLKNSFLHTLIPMNEEEHYPDKCAMFIKDSAQVIKDRGNVDKAKNTFKRVVNSLEQHT